MPIGATANVFADRVFADGRRDVVDTKNLLAKLKKITPKAGIPVEVVDDVAKSMYAPKLPWHLRKWWELKPQSALRDVVLEYSDKESLHLPKKANPFLIAHEVGHAATGRLGRAWTEVGIPVTHLSNYGSIALLGHAALTGKKGEGMAASGYVAPAVAAVAPIADQLEELGATLKARKFLTDPSMKSFRPKNLGKMMTNQQLNYLLGHATKVAPIGVGALALHHYLKAKKEK